MRAFLPNQAMDTPLELEPMANAETVDNVHYAVVPRKLLALQEKPSDGTKGTWATIAFAGLGVHQLLRRARDRRRPR